MTPEQAADHILKAAGSGLRHYTPQAREEILKAVARVLAPNWSDDFSKAPHDRALWVIATDDDGYGYGQAYIWDKGNPDGEPKLVWAMDTRPVEDHEQALLWLELPRVPQWLIEKDPRS